MEYRWCWAFWRWGWRWAFAFGSQRKASIQWNMGFTEFRISLSPYYTMRFLYFALDIRPIANEMYMQHKWFYPCYTLFSYQSLINLELYFLAMIIVSQYSSSMSGKKKLEVFQTQTPLHFLPKRKPKTHSVIWALALMTSLCVILYSFL